MPVIVPSTSARNLTPTSIELESDAICAGVAAALQMLQGQAVCGVMVTVTPGAGCSRLPLSSTARLMILFVPASVGVQAKVQFCRPVACCHVLPLSTDTSTPATPPPESAAVPVMVMAVPIGILWPLIGNVTVEVGGVRSVLGFAGNKPACNVPGCAPMSANRLTVACCMSALGPGPFPS